LHQFSRGGKGGDEGGASIFRPTLLSHAPLDRKDEEFSPMLCFFLLAGLMSSLRKCPGLLFFSPLAGRGGRVSEGGKEELADLLEKKRAEEEEVEEEEEEEDV
jgi:hypothetical protein